MPEDGALDRGSPSGLARGVTFRFAVDAGGVDCALNDRA
jgi:hypothetical protein